MIDIREIGKWASSRRDGFFDRELIFRVEVLRLGLRLSLHDGSRLLIGSRIVSYVELEAAANGPVNVLEEHVRRLEESRARFLGRVGA